MLATAICDLMINILVFKSYLVEKAAVSASMNFLTLFWSMLADLLLFNASFSYFEIFGGLLILLSTTAIVLNNK